MRPVLFLFYTVESMLNILLMSYHIRGFLSHPLSFLPIQSHIYHYSYTACIHLFTVLTLFASINICTGHTFSITEEILRNLFGFILYIYISLMTLEDAESDFHIMYIMRNNTEGVEQAVHPFFNYMRSQAVCALSCGVVYLLHCIIVVDVLLSNEEDSDVEPGQDDSEDYEDADYVPVRLYFLGEMVQTHLEQYEWFNHFSRGTQIPI